MKLATHLKKLLSAVLVAVMLVGSLPVSAFAAEEPIVLLGGGDYQQHKCGNQQNLFPAAAAVSQMHRLRIISTAAQYHLQHLPFFPCGTDEKYRHQNHCDRDQQ